ncbi:MAG: hypothetical protein AMS22_08435 [Thiotrichales bacterium SG8_50]|nr:MAG: hypothetical protein AMS22_08435 [Thiotrichales bacterium SG8_50]
MSEIRKRVAARLAHELSDAGWVECEELPDCYHHKNFGVHGLFDAAYVQRDAWTLFKCGWQLERVGNATYFNHPQLGRHMAHAALEVQHEHDRERVRVALLRVFAAFLALGLIGHILYFFIGG